MTIHIEALTFEAIIGLLDFERDRPQRIIIDLKANYTYAKGVFLDYAHIVALIQSHITKARYILLEDALNGLQKLLTERYPEIDTLSLKISKPDILSVCSVALSLEWERHT